MNIPKPDEIKKLLEKDMEATILDIFTKLSAYIVEQALPERRVPCFLAISEACYDIAAVSFGTLSGLIDDHEPLFRNWSATTIRKIPISLVLFEGNMEDCEALREFLKLRQKMKNGDSDERR
jgi:hypothetical protein